MISVRERNLIESEEASALHSTYFIVYTAKYIEMWYLERLQQWWEFQFKSELIWN